MGKCENLFFVMVGFCLIIGMTNLAMAAENVKVTHSLVSVEKAGSGCVVTLDMAVENTGSSALNDVMLVQTGPLEISDSLDQGLYIGYLPAGSSSGETWTLQSESTSEQMSPVIAGGLHLNVVYKDEFGASASFEATSEGGAE